MAGGEPWMGEGRHLMPPETTGGREEGLIKPGRYARDRPTDPKVPAGETSKELAGVK